MALDLNEGNFDMEVLDSKVPVLVDFWSPTCGPCRKMAPLIDKLANDYAGTAKVAKVDVSDNFGLAERYGIQYLPTLIVFKDGQPVDTQVGAQGPEKLQAMINSAL